MDLLGEARKAFKQAANGISRGAETLKLDADIAELSQLATENYAAIGRRAVVLLKLGRVRDSELESLVGVAEKSEAKLRAAQETRQALQRGDRIRHCPGCGEVVADTTQFCGKCGRKLPVCRQCTQPLSAGDLTCPACGVVVEAPARPQP